MSENMLFCIGDKNDIARGIGYQQNNMVFNKKITVKEFQEIKNSLPDIRIPLNFWIEEKDMTKDEKKNVSGWSEMGGYLKRLGYEEAWAKWWSEASEEDKQSILNCKYFDSEIFTEITGIKDFATSNLKGKEVEVKLDGKTYKAIII